MTKKELEEKIDLMEDNIEYYEKLVGIVANRLQENIDYIDENLKKEKFDSKKKLLLGLKDEFLSIKSLLTEISILEKR